VNSPAITTLRGSARRIVTRRSPTTSEALIGVATPYTQSISDRLPGDTVVGGYVHSRLQLMFRLCDDGCVAIHFALAT
jgi:hypothetical protein